MLSNQSDSTNLNILLLNTKSLIQNFYAMLYIYFRIYCTYDISERHPYPRLDQISVTTNPSKIPPTISVNPFTLFSKNN